MRVRKSKNCEFENKRRLVSDQFGHGESESGPKSTWKWDLDPENSISLWGPMFKLKELVLLLLLLGQYYVRIIIITIVIIA
jgi:hypothetical protein